MERDKLIALLERWAAPYTPLDPLELEEIDMEQKQTAASMTMADIGILLELYRATYIVNRAEQLSSFPNLMKWYGRNAQQAKDAVEVNIWSLVWAYSSLAKQELADHLFSLLKPNGPAEVLCFIGLLNDDSMRAKVLEQIDFKNLTTEMRYEVEVMIEDMFTIDATPYRNKLGGV